MAHVDRYINEESFHNLLRPLLATAPPLGDMSRHSMKAKKQFDLSQTNLAGTVPDRPLVQGQAGCEDTWNTTIDDRTPVRFYFSLFLLVGFFTGSDWLSHLTIVS